MSCGLTPSIIEMLHKMQMEKEQQADEQLQKLETRKVVCTQTQVEATAKDQKYDWTKSYSTWENWEDPEELAAQEEQERKRIANARERTMCNHDHSAVRIDKDTMQNFLVFHYHSLSLSPFLLWYNRKERLWI